jgi:hypothetical protein
MTLVEARAFLKEHAAMAVEMYQKWTALGFDYESPIELARDVLFNTAHGPFPIPPDDQDWPF